jgi:1-acyl-sn-glycerol-3-phosphate acyltransferase
MVINTEKIITEKYPDIVRYPQIFTESFLYLLKRLFHENDINSFLSENRFLQGLDFVEAVIDYFNFKYSVNSLERENIPTEGRVIIIANHPLGALDALTLIKLVSEVRKDVKIIANDMLYSIEQLRPLLLPVDNMRSRYTKESIRAVYESLNREEAVIIFPSGEVSRRNRDLKWKNGFIKFAKKSGSPILPIYIKARNSIPFYLLSYINSQIPSILLVNEMFKQRGKGLSFTIGELIPFDNLNLGGIENQTVAKMLRKHLIRVGKKKRGIFKTQRAIAHPESRQELRWELKNSCKLIGKSGDNKLIYLYEYSDDSSTVLKELGRLREITFRRVGEGSGKKRDKDSYDIYYKHIILWDEDNLEIAGSYRIGHTPEVVREFGVDGLYTSTLFDYGKEFQSYFLNSIELGRSFVQPRYWGSRALDNLWYGIGAYLREHPEVRYMFGTVSLSDSYPREAKDMIIYFYKRFFGVENSSVSSKDRYRFSEDVDKLEKLFTGETYLKNLMILKRELKGWNLTVPTLFKQYTELCEEGGVKFLDFGVDKSFNNAVDGFILVDIDRIKKSKRDRYIDNNL